MRAVVRLLEDHRAVGETDGVVERREGGWIATKAALKRAKTGGARSAALVESLDIDAPNRPKGVRGGGELAAEDAVRPASRSARLGTLLNLAPASVSEPYALASADHVPPPPSRPGRGVRRALPGERPGLARRSSPRRRRRLVGWRAGSVLPALRHLAERSLIGALLAEYRFQTPRPTTRCSPRTMSTSRPATGRGRCGSASAGQRRRTRDFRCTSGRCTVSLLATYRQSCPSAGVGRTTCGPD